MDVTARYAACVRVDVIVLVFVLMPMPMFGIVLMLVVMVMADSDIELDAADAGFLAARDVEMPAVQPQFLQFPLDPRGIHAQINERADEHIAADAAENIQIQGFHNIQNRFMFL
jgi:hypothetical protein